MGLVIDFFYGLLEALSSGQLAVELDGEGDRDRNVRIPPRPRDAARFVGIVHGDGSHHIRAGFRKAADLRRVIGFGLRRRHQRGRPVAIAARPDRPVDDDRRSGRKLLGERARPLDGVAVHLGEPIGIVAKPLAPVGIAAPGRRVEHEAEPALPRQIKIRGVVALQLEPAFFA